eukprot:2273053-Pyramimonas_sp.AAC.1
MGGRAGGEGGGGGTDEKEVIGDVVVVIVVAVDIVFSLLLHGFANVVVFPPGGIPLCYALRAGGFVIIFP